MIKTMQRQINSKIERVRQKINDKVQAFENSRFFNFFISFIAIMLVVVLCLSCAFLMGNAMHEDRHNYIKYRAEFEGRQAYILFLENNKSFDGVELNNLAPENGRHPHIDLNWSYNDGDTYLTLLNEAALKNKEKDSYDFYTSLCRSIQDTRSDYFEKGIDYLVEPVKRTLSDIDENLDCIYENDSFKIIYLLDKEFNNAPKKAPIYF